MSISGIGGVGWTLPSGGIHEPVPTHSAGGPFAKAIDSLLEKVNAQDARAEQAVHDLAEGKTDELHNVMLEGAKADLSFRLILQIRNRLTEAYQEVMRMQV